jgi:hypothetical protein
MAFAADEDDVALPCLLDGVQNGPLPVGNLHEVPSFQSPKSPQRPGSLVQNASKVFGARILRRHDGQVGVLRRHLTHQATFGTIP